ncbi:hypothetical protein M758_UG160500 [Ceratodon purpureus]|nr:hypothetical protein M758_UG160500 [Ceratodon purpureus]
MEPTEIGVTISSNNFDAWALYSSNSDGALSSPSGCPRDSVPDSCLRRRLPSASSTTCSPRKGMAFLARMPQRSNNSEGANRIHLLSQRYASFYTLTSHCVSYRSIFLLSRTFLNRER